MLATTAELQNTLSHWTMAEQNLFVFSDCYFVDELKSVLSMQIEGLSKETVVLCQ